ncbi:MAG: translation initiation factor IF-3 [Solirubrobacterales bacterium]
MALPRRFDRRPPERDTTRVNERIRVKEVRLIGDDGAQIGVVEINEALKYAQERDLDLVEVAPEARPPVCRVLDYSKYKYEQAQKAKASRKHQQQITIREIKLRPKIATHDYDTKKGHVVRFLKHADKVKVTIMFRGREREHPERGRDLLMKMAEEVSELGQIEQTPLLEGRNMTMVLGPTKEALQAHADELHTQEEAAKEARRRRKSEEALAHQQRVDEAKAAAEAEKNGTETASVQAESPAASPAASPAQPPAS